MIRVLVKSGIFGIFAAVLSGCGQFFLIVEGDYDTYEGQTLEGFPIEITIDFGDSLDRHLAFLDEEGRFRTRIRKHDDMELTFFASSWDGIHNPWAKGQLELEPRISNHSATFRPERTDRVFDIGKAYVFNHIKIEYLGPEIVTSPAQIVVMWDDAVPNADTFTFWYSSVNRLQPGGTIHNVVGNQFEWSALMPVPNLDPPLSPRDMLGMGPYVFREPQFFPTRYLIGVTAYYIDHYANQIIVVGSSKQSIGPYHFEYRGPPGGESPTGSIDENIGIDIESRSGITMNALIAAAGPSRPDRALEESLDGSNQRMASAVAATRVWSSRTVGRLMPPKDR